MQKINSTSFFIPLSIIFISNLSFSANRYWVGSGLGNWNNSSNWSTTTGGLSGASIPSVSDNAIFDSGNITNCIIDANVNISGFTINALYTGTININTGITITIAASGFSQLGGTFTRN